VPQAWKGLDEQIGQSTDGRVRQGLVKTRTTRTVLTRDH
jgi:hypothetical protein